MILEYRWSGMTLELSSRVSHYIVWIAIMSAQGSRMRRRNVTALLLRYSRKRLGDIRMTAEEQKMMQQRDPGRRHHCLR